MDSGRRGVKGPLALPVARLPAALLPLAISLWLATRAEAAEPTSLIAELKQLSTTVFDVDQRDEARSMLRRAYQAEIAEANRRSTAQWKQLTTREAWQSFVSRQRELLRDSLGIDDGPAATHRPPLESHVTETIHGEEFDLDKVIFRGRDDVWITAHLYRPSRPADSMPGILICHAHHTPKAHGELQDMGMTWARLGCLVLVMDQFGHGERRRHPFDSAADYPREYRVSRQDYFFRYDNGIQFHLAGGSLIGQMASDLSRGVDFLLTQDGIDPARIVLLGSVAGGGDPAAVTAMLDPRIAVAAPFNFGGPQPETRFPLPENPEEAFNYAGGGSWESTRNLRRSAADGFLPWVIVAGLAPRGLVYAHEFRWDREHDPVWARLERLFELLEARDQLDFTHGSGSVSGQPPESTHCTHIGQVHRQRIHAALARWLKIQDGAAREYSHRIDASRLACWTPELRAELDPKPSSDLFRKRVERARAARGWSRQQTGSQAANGLDRLAERARWQSLLGPIQTRYNTVARELGAVPLGDGASIAKAILETDRGIQVPVVLLAPRRTPDEQTPVVVFVAQNGKRRLLAARAEEIGRLLASGVAVCLLDPRGTGESEADAGRGRDSAATSSSSTALMLGRTHVGGCVSDLLATVSYLVERQSIDPSRIVLWGDSLAEPNPDDTNFAVPHGTDGRPRVSEPLGGLVVLLAALFNGQIRAVHVSGGLVSFADVLERPFVYIPHDAVVPGIVPAGDITRLVAALDSTPIQFARTVDGLNRFVSADRVRAAYQDAGDAKWSRVTIVPREQVGAASAADSSRSATDWVLDRLKRDE